MKIAICLPNNRDTFDADFTMSLLSVVHAFFVWNVGNKHTLGILRNKEGWIDHMRENLAKECIEKGYDWLMWMDTDMIFPSDLIKEMVESVEKYPEVEAITGLYTWKDPPFLPHVYYNYDEKDGRFGAAAGFILDRAFPVVGAGYGCLFISSKVYQRMSHPWFDFKFGEHGEDLFFFKKHILEVGKPVNMVCNPQISCSQVSRMLVNTESFLKFSNLEVIDGTIQVTKDVLDKITIMQDKLNGNFDKKT